MIYIVGIGPGSIDDMTIRAHRCLKEVDIIIGYTTYINLIRDSFSEKEMLATGMMAEVERCKIVLSKVKEGKKVALISSGDSGIYGMAGLMFEVIEDENLDVKVEVVPGVTAFVSAGASLGAPIMHDFCVISLSDLLTPWDVIEKRIKCASEGDFVVSLYNPKSKKRTWQIERTREIMLEGRSANTPVGIVKNSTRKDESVKITTLGKMLEHEMDMFTVVIIGNSETYIEDGRMITPRGYKVNTRMEDQ